ncbi:MAG: MotA/TolQ/ExbB proton channel family protein, partial [Planctomycetales bacterium]|nr:MotA/TolQ/ExbB proton channel family protein [Planctomycetales bacterium]
FFCVVLVWMRVNQKRFRSEAELDAFLAEIEPPLAAGKFDAATAVCDGDARAMPQLALMALASRGMGFVKMRQLVLDRFQRDVLSDLEYRLSWVNTVIKAAPMVGLLGTVLGMMGAFGKLAGSQSGAPDPGVLAEDIMLALITTAAGLSIAIPLVLCAASINVRIQKMEELVAAGLTRFFEAMRGALAATSGKQG